MTISEVGREFGLTPDTLRYYEKEGLIPRVRRNKSGIRDYSDEDIGWVLNAKCMRRAGVSIEILKEYCRLFRMGDKTLNERAELLKGEREKLEIKLNEIKDTLKRLDMKISLYEKASENNMGYDEAVKYMKNEY